MQCANCSSRALYVYDPPSVRPTAFCDRHLPTFLRPAAKAGSLTKAPAFEGSQKQALSAMAAPAKEDPKPAPRRRRKAEPQPDPEEVEETSTDAGEEDPS